MSTNPHLAAIVNDYSTTTEQKGDCLKLLKVVLKNLADPNKNQDPKYRQLKLDNEKIQQKMLQPYPCAVDYLKERLGFFETILVEDDGTNARVLQVNSPVNLVTAQAALHEVTLAHTSVTPPPAAKKTAPCSRSTSASAAGVAVVATNKIVHPLEKLSEKQKARILLEQKQQQDKEAARKHRAKQIALLKRDKYVRQNDVNWVSGVSAAAHKSGDGISTFRDKYGEN